MVLQSGEKSKLANITIILVKPQMAENIGFIARVMLNFSIKNLILVNPRIDLPNDKIIRMSAGASEVIENVKVYNTVAEACKDIHMIYATTVRMRNINKEVINASQCGEEIKNMNSDSKIGILIGPENSGLDNKDVSIANKILTLPVNNNFSSLNISHAVGIICYEILKSNMSNIVNHNYANDIADNGEINNLLQHLEQELEVRNFFQEKNKKQKMLLNINNIFRRIPNFTSQEVRTLRGIIKSLTTRGNK